MITADHIKAIAKTNPDPQGWADKFNAILPKYEVTTKVRICGFLSQTAVESGGFTTLTENLNYSADRLMVIFPKYFKGLDTTLYHRKPELIANRVYGGRMGNTEPGDGWKYRGRGIIQLTGKDNYSKFSISEYQSDYIVQNPDLVSKPEDAVKSACWYWAANKLNATADTGDVVALTKKINGGTHGLEDRQFKYDILMKFDDIQLA